MKLISIRIVALLIGLWVAIAPAMFAVQAGAMTMQMSASGDHATSDDDCCPTSGSDQKICPLLCINSMSFAIAPISSDVMFAVASAEDWLDGDVELTGHALPPDPPRPKPASPR